MTSLIGSDRFRYRSTTQPQAFVRATRLAVPAIIVLALALRLTHYLLNPSLSNDEASLALNLIHRSYTSLFERLDFNQAGPPGFLLLQKLLSDVFGTSPYSLRFAPLLAGVVSCLLIHRVTARVAGPLPALIALTMFALSYPMITYAATNKQYALDVLVVLALYAMAIDLPGTLHARETALFALVGMAAVFLSHPAVFVVATIWSVLSVRNAAAHRWAEVGKLAAIGVAWIGSFAIAYLATRASIEQIQESVPIAWERPAAALRTLAGTVRYLLGIPTFAPEVRGTLTCIAIILSLIGIGVLARRSLSLTVMLIMPTILATGAVLVGLYPNFARTFLFIMPSVMVLIASGSGYLVSPHRRRIIRSGGVIALALLVGAVAFKTVSDLRPSKLSRSKARARRPHERD